MPETFTLTPAAQAHYNAGMKALKDGGVYRDDIGQCGPAGAPLIMTRVWPIAMIQLPTAIYMVSGFMNSLRIIYLPFLNRSMSSRVVALRPDLGFEVAVCCNGRASGARRMAPSDHDVERGRA